MSDMIMLISRVEPLQVLLDRIASTIISSFGIEALVICVLEEQSGLFMPRIVRGFPPDNTQTILKHTYTLERKKRDLSDEFRVGQRTYHVKGKILGKLTSDDMDYISTSPGKDPKARTANDWQPLDHMTFLMVDRLDNRIGWIEIFGTSDGRIPPRDTIVRIQLLADLAGVAVENSRMYEDAISAMTESQGYLDLIVHDIGNMVQPLIYYLEKAHSGDQRGSEMQTYISKALDVSTATKALVEGVRKISEARSKGGAMTESHDLRDVLVKCISLVKRSFPSKDLVVSFDCPDCECLVAADELLPDLFSNLLSNAVKYNPQAYAEVDVAIENGSGVWIVTVQDRGIGIPDEKKGEIFSRFAKRPEGVGGTGLGLSIVSLLVERYNGVVSVRDRVAGDHTQGACFEVAFPKVDQRGNSRQYAGADMLTAYQTSNGL